MNAGAIPNGGRVQVGPRPRSALGVTPASAARFFEIWDRASVEAHVVVNNSASWAPCIGAPPCAWAICVSCSGFCCFLQAAASWHWPSFWDHPGAGEGTPCAFRAQLPTYRQYCSTVSTVVQYFRMCEALRLCTYGTRSCSIYQVI